VPNVKLEPPRSAPDFCEMSYSLSGVHPDKFQILSEDGEGVL
jgi:hypothetical protein